MNALTIAISLLAPLQAPPQSLSLTVDGVERAALVYAPESARSKPSPLVFCWHGHGGGSRQAANSFQMHRSWPQAIAVYPQGLPTSGRTDPEGLRAGWQITTRGPLADRDLKFFDALFARIQKDYSVDLKRVYAMGHSNGGRFTYVLWQARGDVFAAFGPSGSPALGMIRNFKPKPVFHIAGEKDQLVSFSSQKLTIDGLEKLLKCSKVGANTSGYLTTQPGENGLELATYVHPGGHEYPRQAVPLMVEFFKRHPKT